MRFSSMSVRQAVMAEKSSTSALFVAGLLSCVTANHRCCSSSKSFVLSPNIRVVQNCAVRSRFASRQSICSLISATVLLRRSLNHGESFLAQSLQRLPSSSLRFPKSPIFSPQISQYFLSNNHIAKSLLSWLLHVVVIKNITTFRAEFSGCRSTTSTFPTVLR